MFISKDETVASAAPKGAGVLHFGVLTSTKKEKKEGQLESQIILWETIFWTQIEAVYRPVKLL